MIVASNVSFSYPNGTPALKEVSFCLEDGKKYALVGANGAGKSTLLSLLCALELPQGGTLTIGGITLGSATVQEVRNSVGMVFQNPDDQLFMPTVFDDVAFGLRNRGIAESIVREQVNVLLDRMGLAHLKDRPPYRLSGGEKRSVAIATAMILEPQTLLMDEPTAFLDTRARRGFLNMMHSLQTGMIIATPDLDLARGHTDGVLVLKDGSIFAQGGTELLGNAQLMEDALLV